MHSMLKYDGLSVYSNPDQYKTVIEPTNIHIADYPFNKFVYFSIDNIEFRNDDTEWKNRHIKYVDIVTKDQLPTVPTKTSQLTNDSGFLTDSSLTDYLQTNTFKDIEWSNTAGNSKHDFTLNVSDTGGPGDNGEYLLRMRNYYSTGEVGTSVLVCPTFGFDVSSGNRDARLTPSQLLIDNPNKNERTYVTSGGVTIKGNIGSSAESSVLLSYLNMSINGKVIYYKDLQTASDVSTAISNQTKETWTFTLEDGTTVNKSVVLG